MAPTGPLRVHFYNRQWLGNVKLVLKYFYSTKQQLGCSKRRRPEGMNSVLASNSNYGELVARGFVETATACFCDVIVGIPFYRLPSVVHFPE